MNKLTTIAMICAIPLMGWAGAIQIRDNVIPQSNNDVVALQEKITKLQETEAEQDAIIQEFNDFIKASRTPDVEESEDTEGAEKPDDPDTPDTTPVDVMVIPDEDNNFNEAGVGDVFNYTKPYFDVANTVAIWDAVFSVKFNGIDETLGRKYVIVNFNTQQIHTDRNPQRALTLDGSQYNFDASFGVIGGNDNLKPGVLEGTLKEHGGTLNMVVKGHFGTLGGVGNVKGDTNNPNITGSFTIHPRDAE